MLAKWRMLASLADPSLRPQSALPTDVAAWLTGKYKWLTVFLWVCVCVCDPKESVLLLKKLKKERADIHYSKGIQQVAAVRQLMSVSSLI